MTKVMELLTKVINLLYNGYLKFLNKIIKKKYKKYISGMSVFLTIFTLILLLLIISQVCGNFSSKDDIVSDSISLEYLVNSVGQEADEIIENHKISITSKKDEEDDDEDEDENLDFNHYKDSFNHYVISSIDDLSNVSENKYLDYDIVASINKTLSDYFDDEFRFQNYSDNEIECFYNELYKNPQICGIYKTILTLKPDFNENHHNLYDEDQSEHSLDRIKNSTYVNYLSKFEELTSYGLVLPYASYQYAIASNCYSIILNRQYDKALSIGITSDEIMSKSLDTVYLFLYDLSFNNYELPNGEMHDTNFSYYSIGMTYYGLAMNMENDFDKAKYLSMAIYFFDNSYEEDTEEYNPKYQIKQCYNDLSKIELLKNYRKIYINKGSD